ncbi:MAG: TIGR00159 family protein [Cytophagales bacterium]|nr:MAG: TIGR00159 family protein [Cytophagales bacterium]
MSFLFHIGFLEVNWVDLLDISIVAFIIYQLYRLMRGRVAANIFLGILAVYMLYLVVKALKMELLSAVLGQFMGVGLIAILIIFQPDIRKFLMISGKRASFTERFLYWFVGRKENKINVLNMNPIVDTAKFLGASNTGALIVFAKKSDLKFYIESGDLIDAEISKRLLISIFHKNSPLHDGAVIIVGGRIKAARCILPVSEQIDIPARLGLRHRAAIGITEVTDSLVLVVSEETGEVSLAIHGQLINKLSKAELKSKLNHYLYEEEEGQAIKDVEEEVQEI